VAKTDPYSGLDPHRKAYIEQNLSVLADPKPEDQKTTFLEDAYVAHCAAAQTEDEQRKAALEADEANLLELAASA
jgi:hypothetical protein